jgi:hypothetical protein
MKWVTGEYKDALIQYLRLSELLLSGVPLSENQETQYNASQIAIGVWEQPKPRLYEETILLVLATNMKLLCYKKIKISISILLQKMYNKPFILFILLNMKHSKSIKNFEKLIAYYLTKLTNN